MSSQTVDYTDHDVEAGCLNNSEEDNGDDDSKTTRRGVW